MEVKYSHSTKLFFDRALGIHEGPSEIKVPAVAKGAHSISLENIRYPSKNGKVNP